MWSRVKASFYRYVPAHIGNPFGLIRRMLSSGNRAALFTLFVTGLGILCIPLDLLLSVRERRLLSQADPKPNHPVVFICGPARSGTTLVFQVLCKHLDVSYLQNITALFPRSPITVTKIYRKIFGLKRTRSADYQNYYGKTSGMYGPSEANHIWNRWVQPDATGFRTELSEKSAREAARFFSAFSMIDEKPVIAKNNNMNVFADVMADAIPSALIICLRRSPEFLAQSLLQARRDIKGTVNSGYGVQEVNGNDEETDPIAEVCSQVIYLNDKASELQSAIGADRFWIIDYEEFCGNPGRLIAAVAAKMGLAFPRAQDQPEIEPIAVRNSARDPQELDQIRARFDLLARKQNQKE